MARIIDLDLITPPSVWVRKDGVEYELPGDPPVDVWLGVVQAFEDWQAAIGPATSDALRNFDARVLDLFRLRDPGLEALPFGPAGMYAVLSGFYGDDLGEEPEREQRPTRPARAGSTTKTKRGSATSAAKRKTTTKPSRSSSS